MVTDGEGRSVASEAGLARFDVLGLTAGLWFLGKFLRYAFPPLFGTIGDTYGVSRAVLGAAFTAFMLCYAAMQFPSGYLADRAGSVRILAGGAVVAAVGALVLVVDAPFLVLAGGMVLVGAGTGAYKTVSVRLLSRTYPARTGRVLGVYDTFGTFGGVAAPVAVVLSVGLPPILGAPWRTTFVAGGLATLALAAALHVRLPASVGVRSPATGHATTDGASDGEAAASDASAGDTSAGGTSSGGTAGASDHDAGPDGPAAGALLALFRDRRFGAFVAVTVLFSFAYNGAIAFLPLYLATETPLSAATANLLFGALFVVSLVQLVTGEANDRIGALPVVAGTLGVASVGLLAVLALSSGGSVLVLGGAVVAMGIGAHGFRPVRGAYLMAVVPDDVAGSGLGVVRTLLMGAGAIAPGVVGVLSEVADFRVAFGLLAAALVCATGLTVLLWLGDR